MKLLISALLSICIICAASAVQQLDRPAGKVIVIGGNVSNNTVNLTNMTNITGNFTNKTLNTSGLNASIFKANSNESVMQTPSEAGAQSDLGKYDLSSLGKDKHDDKLS